MENNNTTILGFICLTIISIVSYFIYTPVKQKVWIKNVADTTLTVSTDTVFADKSIWYYEPDSCYNKTIRVTIYRDKEGKGYITNDLVPNDFVYLKLKPGINWVHLNSIGTHPFINKRIKVIKIKEKK